MSTDEKAPETTSVFPLFPLSDEPSAQNSTTSNGPQWLSNASFTVDLSVVHDSVTSKYGDLKPTAIEQELGEDTAVREQAPTAPIEKPSYAFLDSSSSSRSSSEVEERNWQKKRKRKKKKKKERDGGRRSREVVAESQGYGYGDLRKSGVRAWADSQAKPPKDYYFDSHGDRDNLVFGSLYRMDVARYKHYNVGESHELQFRHFYQRRRFNSMLDGEADTDALDGKVQTGGRYWSAKLVGLERRKDFKRVRVVASVDVCESSEFIPFLESFHGESSTKVSELEESWEEKVLRKTREFNKMSRESPHDEKVWLAFAEFQDQIACNQPQKAARLQTLERKISILEKATELNPDNEELLLCLMQAYQRRDSGEVLIAKWEKVLVDHSGNCRLWREFLRVLQGDFSRFKVSVMRKMYAQALQALSAACGKLYRQVHRTGKSPSEDPAFIQLEHGIVDIFLSLCRLEWQSGYQELATALFQAEIEYSLFCPSLLLTEQSKQKLFEHFWNENGAKLGEEGAHGWSMWLEKEEENKQKVIAEESLLENDEGGWTGWSDPPSMDAKIRGSLEHLVVDDKGGKVFDDDLETDDIAQEDDNDSLLKKLGIDVDAEADCDISDSTTWTRWAEEELSRDIEQWMPVREKSGAPDGHFHGEIDEQLSRVILFEDINEYLFSLCSEKARFYLVSQFIDFFGGRISQWFCSNSPSWIEKTLSIETLPDSILDYFRKVHESVVKKQVISCNASLESLLGTSNDISRRIDMMKFLRNAILLCLTSFPRNYILEEAALVADELYATKMNSFTCSVTPCRALAKGLLKNDRQDLLLCGVYARREAASGNIDIARKAFDMALSFTDGLQLDFQSVMPLLYFWYAELELANFLEQGSESSSSRALHILSCLGSGVKYSAFTGQPSSLQLLKARQGFKEQIRMLRSTWAHGDIKDESVALICSAALFEGLVSGWIAGIEVIEEAFSMVLPERRNQSSQLEGLFNYYIKILWQHLGQSRFSKVWQSLLHGLQMYPYNPELFATFIEIGCLCTVPNKLRWIFDEYCHRNPSVIVWLFALSFELGKSGAHHRIHALFERALSNDQLQNSVILWRCYMAYEINIAQNLFAAKRIFFRAIHACPWSKKLWLDGFLKLNSALTAKELADLQDVMRDKELHLKTDIYEILLQVEMKM